jgi:hypothetical protein
MIRAFFPVLPDTPFAAPGSLQGPLSAGVSFQSTTVLGFVVRGIVQRYHAGSIRSVPFEWLPVSPMVAHCWVNFDKPSRIDHITLARCILHFRRRRAKCAGRAVTPSDGEIATGDGRYCFEGGTHYTNIVEDSYNDVVQNWEGNGDVKLAAPLKKFSLKLSAFLFGRLTSG